MSGFPRPYGRYVLDERIAMGGMAEIFRARTATQGFEKKVCIKRILPHFLEDEQFVTMFRDEARTAAKLQHANVVQVFDFGEEEGTLYLAMELVDGADLRRVLEAARKKKMQLEVGAVIQIGIDVSRGLQHAHTLSEGGRTLGIVHRDISPHNILLSRAGEVKVTDFGIAKAAERSTHTGTGIVKGKVAYMAPEQAEGLGFDHRLDQFAVGVVLWETLCGRRLFVAENEIATLRKVLACEVSAPSTVRGDIPPALDEVILRTLQRDPAARFADMRALELALSRVLYGGAIDPASADLREMFARVMDENGAAPLRKTQVADAGGVQAQLAAAPPAGAQPKPASADLPPSSKTVTQSDPAFGHSSVTTDEETGAQPSSDVSRVFSSSDKRPIAPGGLPATEADASNPLAHALKQSGAAAAASAPTVAEEDPRIAASAPHSAPVPERSSLTKSASDVSLSAAAAAASDGLPPTLALTDDGTPATRTHVPASASAAALRPAPTAETGVAAAPPPALSELARDVRPRRSPLRAAALGAVGGLVAVTVVIGALLSRGGEEPAATPAPAPAPSPPPPAAVAPPPEPTAAPADVPVAAPVTDAGVPAAAEPAVDPAPPDPGQAPRTVKKATGKILLKFDKQVGWGNVSVDGGAVREVTEQLVLPLPAGKHRVRVQNPDAKLDREIVVEVVAGKVRSYSAVTGKSLDR